MTPVIAGNWNPLDLVLIICLCVAIPAYALIDSLRPRETRAPRNTTARALRNGAWLGIPLAVLAFDWWISGRSVSALGLALPLSWPGEIGLAFAVVVLLGLSIASRWSKGVANRDASLAKLKDAGLLVETRAEMMVFIPHAVLVGCGSEVLFRGFLFWAFMPLVGTFGCVLVAGVAYGLGHGFRKWQDGVGSLISAFLFAAGYALQSLWWLMLFHTAFALNAGWVGYRLSRRADSVSI